MVIQWSHQLGKVCDKVPKMANHSYELSDGGVRVGFWDHLSDCLHLLFTGLHPILCDMMCKKNNFIMEQATFGWLKF